MANISIPNLPHTPWKSFIRCLNLEKWCSAREPCGMFLIAIQSCPLEVCYVFVFLLKCFFKNEYSVVFPINMFLDGSNEWKNNQTGLPWEIGPAHHFQFQFLGVLFVQGQINGSTSPWTCKQQTWGRLPWLCQMCQIVLHIKTWSWTTVTCCVMAQIWVVHYT